MSPFLSLSARRKNVEKNVGKVSNVLDAKPRRVKLDVQKAIALIK